MENLSTSALIFLIVIISAFFWFAYQLISQYRLNRLLADSLKEDDVLESLKDSKLNKLYVSYHRSITISTESGVKTNTPASYFFNDKSATKEYRINLRLLDSASGILVGLGLLGTFWGLTEGISGFDSSNSQNIQSSIQSLLNGMGTAFVTSLVGMLASLLFTALDKPLKKSFYRSLDDLADKIDEAYYIDDVALTYLNQQALFDNLQRSLKEQFALISKELNEKLMYTNENDERVTMANGVRAILAENLEQSKALKSFSTDLAIELSQGFDNVLSKQMQEKILPLMQNVDSTTKVIVEHIDQMTAQMSSPATDLIQNVVDELKRGMASMIEEFKSGLSGSATNEMEKLASQLGTAAQSMADFPRNMENISTTLQVTIDEVKNAISEISNTSANANSTAMQQMQEQIAFATGAISNAITEVKDVMGSITQSSQEQNQQMVSKLAEASEKMSSFLNSTMSSLSASVQKSIQGITDDVASKQADLIALQEDTTSQTKKLLDSFNVGLERLERMNDSIAGTMNMFQQAQGQITGSTAHLQTISGDMKLATQVFSKTQSDYTSKMEDLQKTTQRSINTVIESIDMAGEMSNDYANKFEVIKQGLGVIFAQLQKGLTEYSLTVQSTTQNYLEQYSSNLTQTTEALSSAIENQRQVVEELNEILTSKKQ